jgi:ATP-dependent Clp protease ATP-binding subunit ClpC
MNLLLLPKRLLWFWYTDAVAFFVTFVRHTSLYLEEDLGVSLMWRLLFVPMFHDGSLVGWVLSFCFRLFRICIGVFAIGVSALGILFLATYWFLVPLLVVMFAILPHWLQTLDLVVFFSGMTLYIHHLFTYPPKKAPEIKDVSEIWQASHLTPEKVRYELLLNDEQVLSFLHYLEIEKDEFSMVFSQTTAFDLQYIAPQVFDLIQSVPPEYIESRYFLVGWLLSLPHIDGLLMKLNLTQDDLVDGLAFFQKRAEHWRRFYLWDKEFEVHHLRGVNRGWLGVPTPIVDSYCHDLTQKVSRETVPDFIGRDGVVDQIIKDLSLEKGQNVIISGEVGSGKEAVVLYLAKMIVRGDAPQTLATKRVVELDLPSLLSGVHDQGELAERIKGIFDEVKISGQLIVYVSEIHNLALGEVGLEFNLLSLLEPYLSSSDFQFLASTEPVNFNKTLQKNPHFASLFRKVDLPSATDEETYQILTIVAIERERYKKIATSIRALKEVIEVARHFLHQEVLPGSALTLFEGTSSYARDGWVTKSVVEELAQQEIHVPLQEVFEDQRQKLLHLEDIIHKNYIDQKEAVSAVSSALRRSAAKVSDDKRPIGSFLFVGPTGVGKTELCKILAKVYFSGEESMIRFDMSEYQTPEAVNRLLGQSDRPGELTEKVIENPFSLILLDEFEKADYKILNLFLQILDDGRVTDASGKTVDFTSCIIIATSNAASLTIAKGLQQGLDISGLKPMVDGELLKVFKPELINRFDEVVVFKPLSNEDLERVVQLKLDELQKKLKKRGFDVSFADGLIKTLADKGFDPVMGARPLRRLIQSTIENKLSVMLLDNKVKMGDSIVIDRSYLD